MLSPEELERKKRALEEKRRLRRDKRRKRKLFYIICVLLGLLLLAGTAYWSYYSRLPGGFADRSGRDYPHLVNILLLGTDSGLTEASRSDTMILFSVDTRDGGIGALAIPRDTQVRVPGRRGYDRVNAAHAYGGPKLAMRTVERLLDFEIDYYVRVDYDGFEAMVDTLGGVVIDVDKRMHYEDLSQGLKIDLKQGVQLLSGKEALQYVRYRGDHLGDIALVDPENGEYAGRVARQLKFVRALMSQALSGRNLLNAPRLVSEFKGTVTSNIPPDEALRLFMLVKDVKTQDIQTGILPGVGEKVGGASYWVLDQAKTRELINKVIIRRGAMVRVEVLNGNGSSGVASQVADLLRQKGFEVVAVGNADHFQYAETSVIPRGGDRASASQVARALGGQVAGTWESARPIYATDADVTVIVGQDYPI